MARKNRNSARPKRDPPELEAAARHVSYEIRMLLHSAAELGGWHASPPTTLVDDSKNMALECFLLHFRNLRAFLCPSLQNIYGDDILASDLLGELEVRDIGNAAILSKDKERLDKMLAHLSYTRRGFIEAQNYGWHTAEMELALIGQLEVFFGLLTPAMRAWFPPADEIVRAKRAAEDDRAAAKHYVTTTNVVFAPALPSIVITKK